MTKTKAPPIDPRYVSLLWAGPERAGEIAALHGHLFDPGWDEKSIATTLEHPGASALVAMAGTPKVILGFVLAMQVGDEAEILSIGVAPEMQRRGLGRLLIEGLIRATKRTETRRLFLEVAADNDAAFALYRGLGFTEIGRRKGYYQRKGGVAVDALNLALTIS